MSEKSLIVHNSRMRCYRMPGGAVSAGTKVKIGLDVAAELKAVSVKLRTWRDKAGEALIPMEGKASGKASVHYSCELNMPEQGCLIWYFFIIETAERQIFYGNNAEGLGGEGQVCEGNPPSFQITVYRKGAVTPDWFKNAVMYQIFPDRFHRKGDALIRKKGAVIHADWNDKPCYYKDVDTKEIVAYDFFGGNLAGIMEKLPYLKELGISVIYLNPIFEAASNHRYDTGDYHKIDPLLGTNEDFAALCRAAGEMGIKIILDGVFSHTGSDSKYFNREGHYAGEGAFQSVDSPYYEWYDFVNHPYGYNSWWGFDTLPNVKETTKSYMDFVINNDESVLKYWLRQGIGGWRLDVIDELPQEFSRRFFKVLKEENKDAVLIGEVWEDASNKVSYSVPREYLCGDEMDSAMNYPFRKILLDFVLGYVDAAGTNRKLLSLSENYPPENFYAMMNLIGSHDVERVLTLLGEAPSAEGMPAVYQAKFELGGAQYALAVKRLKLLSLWQMSFPGVPCVYYGDEAGMQGYRDPYNRGAYTWDHIDEDLQGWYKKIIALRNRHQALRTGEWIPLYDKGDVYSYARKIAGGKDTFGAAAEDDVFVAAFNRNAEEAREVSINVRGVCHGMLKDLLSGETLKVRAGKITICLKPLQAVLYQQEKEGDLKRGAGVLLHPSSLPSKYGIGDFGKSAYEFVNFLLAAKQKFWQILPLNPVGYGYSPYQSPSAFAGNPLLISLGKLVSEGLLTPYDVKAPFTAKQAAKAKLSAVETFKKKCLRLAYKNFISRGVPADYKDFCQKQSKWLEDYALFMALKKHFHDAPWTKWSQPLIQREPSALAKYRRLLAEEVGYQKFVQYVFFKQWKALRLYANVRGVQIIGDMPIFIAHDSADVWANQGLFTLDEKGRAEKVAGVPPDYFSSTGQLWGNPHYRWDRMKEDDYLWWRERFAALYDLVDIVRIDHFRGFEAYWEVDGTAKTAVEGKWVKGPGADFFRAIEKYFGKLPVIAEDLGVITDEVTDLKDEFALPGMKVLQFELFLDENKKMGFSCEQNCVVYTGTHDNNTTVGWLQDDLDDETLEAVGELLAVEDIDTKEACFELIKYAYRSNAAVVIIPIQDWLSLPASARMNTPGTVGENWQWRAEPQVFSDGLAQKIAALTDACKR